jgi:hypothetical protein
MEALFTSDYLYLWVDDAEQQRLKRRASVTSVLLSLLFALGYVSWLFKE